METISLEQLATTAGLALFLKLLWIPLLKTLAPKITGRGTVIAAFVSGLVLRVIVALVLPAESKSTLHLCEAGLQGLLAAAAAIGFQETATAALRTKES